MAALFFLLVATLFQLATAQQESTTIPAVVLEGNGNKICPSLEEFENGLLAIRKQVKAILDKLVIPECGDGLWYSVAYLNMTDPSQQCPPTWRLYNDSGVRACGRPVTSGASCPATFYTTGRQYSKVCGRVTGYQVATTDGFLAYRRNISSSADDNYVDGISITHGNPRSHIWTFAAGGSEVNSTSSERGDNCPCSQKGGTQAPMYIENNYYCESGNSDEFPARKSYISDPLWDGKQCEGQCCSNGKSPPWFSVELPTSTTDDIEVRICADESIEDTPVSLVEIFVK